MVKNFRYVEPGRIALSGVPETAESVDWLAEHGIRSVVSLHPVPMAPAARLRDAGFNLLSFPIEDFSRGMPGSLGELFNWIDRQAVEQPAVLIH